MVVHQAEDGMEVLANNVYLIPPKKNLTIYKGALLLNDKSKSGINLPIDIFSTLWLRTRGKKASRSFSLVPAVITPGERLKRWVAWSWCKMRRAPNLTACEGGNIHWCRRFHAPEEMPKQILAYICASLYFRRKKARPVAGSDAP